MLTLFSGFFLVCIFLIIVAYSFFSFLRRFSIIRSKFMLTVNSLIYSPVSQGLYTMLFIFVLVENVLGNIPLAIVPTLFYSKTLTLALVF
jgi:uncharacterized membrane protein YidH (DUF202 family)